MVSIHLWKHIPSGCPQWFSSCFAHHGCVNNASLVASHSLSSMWKPDPHSSVLLLINSPGPDESLGSTCTLCSGWPQPTQGFTSGQLSTLFPVQSVVALVIPSGGGKSLWKHRGVLKMPLGCWRNTFPLGISVLFSYVGFFFEREAFREARWIPSLRDPPEVWNSVSVFAVFVLSHVSETAMPLPAVGPPQPAFLPQ